MTDFHTHPMTRLQMEAHLTLHGWEVYSGCILVSQEHGSVYKPVHGRNVHHMISDREISQSEEWGGINNDTFWKLALYIVEKGLI